jgi:hypothetical protein
VPAVFPGEMGDRGAGSSCDFSVTRSNATSHAVEEIQILTERRLCVSLEPPFGVCFNFWKSGQCQVGAQCKFKHQPGDVTGARACVASTQMPAAAKTPALEPPMGVCFTFWKSGQCAFSATCKYKHEQPAVAALAAEVQESKRRAEELQALLYAERRRAAEAETKLKEREKQLKEAQRKPADKVLADKQQFAHATEQQPDTLQSPRKKRKGQTLTINACEMVNVTVAPQSAQSEGSGNSRAQVHVTNISGPPVNAALHRESVADTDPFRDAIPKLMALTGYKIREKVADGHEEWLLELLQDVKHATGYTPAHVLSVARSLLHFLIQAVHESQLADERGSTHESLRSRESMDTQESAGERGGGGGGARSIFPLLHSVKVRPISCMLQRAAFARTDLKQIHMLTQPERANSNNRHTVTNSNKNQTLEPPYGVCFNFWKSGQCHVGARCKFKHQHGNDETGAGACDKNKNKNKKSCSQPTCPTRTDIILGQLCSEPGPLRAASGDAL